MDVITTHLNADFDALGSMLAAKKLYPGATLIFPGSQERNLRNFFIESTLYAFEIATLRNLDLAAIKRLILVDIRQADRIGPFEEVARRPDVELHIYDHHPDAPNDLQGAEGRIREVGANTTLMLECLKEKGIDLSPEEATVMMLGIYEDTGSLTFPSTTVSDYEAAAFLLTRKADLNTVAHFITNELTIDQVALLHDLIESMENIRVRGIDVMMATASVDRYLGDLAVLVHKLKDMENLDVLFAIARMEDRVFLVGRSRIEEVNVGEVARAFGGGGHATAASATLRDLTPFQVKEKLKTVLADLIEPQQRASDLMTTPARTIDVHEPLGEVGKQLTGYNIDALPVVQDGALVGLINHQLVNKAIHHGLEGSPVEDFMITDFSTVEPDTPLTAVREQIIDADQSLLPVVSDGSLRGVITSTDLLRAFQDSTTRAALLWGEASERSALRRKKLGHLMKERLPREVMEILRQVGLSAEGFGCSAYAVGGFVRDLLLRRKNLDIDIVLEGDGIDFARRFAKEHGSKSKTYPHFGTAVVEMPGGLKIDVATARLEYYESPASLPSVEGGPIKLDLYRRDFSINAMAVALNPSHFGELLDFFGGQRDIKDRVVRALHNMSFVEDPTRIFRAVRFEQRFGYEIGKQTLYLIRNAINKGFLELLSGPRCYTELKLILQEDRPLDVLRRVESLGALKAIHPEKTLNTKADEVFRRLREVCSWFDLLYLDIPYERWLVNFFGLMAFLNEKTRRAFAKRLRMAESHARMITRDKRLAEEVRLAFQRNAIERKSEIYRMLDPLPVEVKLYLMARSEQRELQRAISDYFTRLCDVRVETSGGDLKKMGLEPGPRFKRILNRLLDARLDGEVSDHAGELEFVRRHYLQRNDDGEAEGENAKKEMK